MIEPADPFDAGLLLADAMSAHGVSYALGGALALGLWAVPRATVDVDINVFVGPDRLDDCLRALRSLGIAADDAVRDQSAREGMFKIRFGMYPLDVFTASVEFSWEAERTRVSRRIGGRDIWFLSAEALAVFKLLYFRPKDIVDLQTLIAIQGSNLDAAYIRKHLVAMMGEDDQRVVKWDELWGSGFPS